MFSKFRNILDARHSPFSGRVPFGCCYALGLASFQASYSSTNCLYGLVRLPYRTEGIRKRPYPLSSQPCSQALNIAFSVGVGRVDVFGQRLFIVAAFAERLPVVLIPEKFLVTTVWNDVIHNRCPDVLALLGTLHTKWMSFQIRLSDFLPPPVVSTLRCRAGHLWMERQVLLTVEPAGFHQLWAARVMARCLWSVRHFSFSSYWNLIAFMLS